MPFRIDSAWRESFLAVYVKMGALSMLLHGTVAPMDDYFVADCSQLENLRKAFAVSSEETPLNPVVVSVSLVASLTAVVVTVFRHAIRNARHPCFVVGSMLRFHRRDRYACD